MGKLQDYDFKRFPLPLLMFKEDVRNLLNFGKAQFQCITATTAPTFAGRSGEVTFIHNGTAGFMYVYMGTSWNAALVWTADGAPDVAT